MQDSASGNVVILNPDAYLRARGAEAGAAGSAPVPPSRALLTALNQAGLNELSLSFDTEHRILFAAHRPSHRMSFTPPLLADVRKLQIVLQERCANAKTTDEMPLRFLVWSSMHDGVYNLGGDLALIADLIESKDKPALTRYARACVDACYYNAINAGLPIVSIGLVQGDALGGGFESALSNDIIVAERRAKFGLPEILFGLFPGMGAYSFLGRRVGAKQAERMILSGKLYTAAELHDLGIVDVLAEDGKGREAMYEHIRNIGRHYPAHRALYRVRQCFQPLAYQEMIDVVDIWVDTALDLDEQDIKRMRRLLAAQERRRAAHPAAAGIAGSEHGVRGRAS